MIEVYSASAVKFGRHTLNIILHFERLSLRERLSGDGWESEM